MTGRWVERDGLWAWVANLGSPVVRPVLRPHRWGVRMTADLPEVIVVLGPAGTITDVTVAGVRIGDVILQGSADFQAADTGCPVLRCSLLVNRVITGDTDE